MFTGIVVGIGTVLRVAPRGGDVELLIEAAAALPVGSAVGDSICVAGVCLTATRIEGNRFAVDVSRETLALTTLGALTAGARVNLEPALRAGAALGGHYVSGHVDGRARVVALEADGRSRRLRCELSPALARYLAPKGSVTLDGVSLTVNEVGPDRCDINLIPHTLATTTLGALAVADEINVEIDLIARYIERLLESARDRR
jgi:riboflavin synthase